MADKDFLDHLIRTQEKIADDVSIIKQTQASHLEVLKDHTRRSLANEEAILLQRAANELTEQKIMGAIAPLQAHVSQVNVVLKIAGFVGIGIVSIAGLVLTILQIIAFFK